MSGFFTEYNGETYLSRSKLVNRLSQHYKKHLYYDHNEEAPQHGPALLVEEIGDKDMDFVPCIKIPSWPTFGVNALDRIEERLSVETRTKLKSEGCHLVGVAHANSSNPDLEFRISFSVAEKLLIRTWTTKQMKLYFLCKELF